MKPYRAVNAIWVVAFLITVLINGLITFSDIEPNSFWGTPEVFEFSKNATTPGILQPIECPFVITAADKGSVGIAVVNDTNEVITPALQMNLSRTKASQNMRRMLFPLEIAPNSRVHETFDLDEGNVQYGSMILARAYLRRTETYPPGQTSACGFYYLNTTAINGKTITLLGFLTYAVMTIAMILRAIWTPVDERSAIPWVLTGLSLLNLLLVVLYKPSIGLIVFFITLILIFIGIQVGSGKRSRVNPSF
ncbi:MAG TPA: hypothetical protein PKD55_07005 [Bellilinea sp.]|nr:hypothetical protein [Bellilinea sp.]